MRVARHLLVRAARRVHAHRGEAAAFFGFVVVGAVLARVSGVVPPVFHWLAHTRDAGIPGAVVLALTLAWVPLMIIDMKRCTRETALRKHVQADLDARKQAEQAALDAIEAVRHRVSEVLATDGPQIVYQPIVDIATQEVLGLEALSRFSDDQGPAEWFTAAAAVGLGTDLELSAVRRALVGLAHMPENAYLAVNVSPDTLADRRLVDLVRTAPPGRIVLELTEHCAVADYGPCRTAMKAFRAHGVRLAVDDAGAGYASLRHIIDLAPDIIKVDRSLVKGIDADAARRSLFVALVTFARDLGASLVAEGVETAAEAHQLSRWGVGLGQGWYFGRPAPLAASVRRGAA